MYEQKHYIHNQQYVTDMLVHTKHEKNNILEIIAVITARKPSIRSHSLFILRNAQKFDRTLYFRRKIEISIYNVDV